MMTRQSLLRVLLRAAVFTAVVSAAADLLLRNVSLFLPQGGQLAAIFSQLRHAEIRPPVLLLFPLSFAYCFLTARWKRPAAVIVGLFAAVALLALGLYAASVNGILFGDVLRSLLDALRKGGLEGL